MAWPYQIGMAAKQKAGRTSNRIREIREGLGLTAEILAQRVNSTEAQISRLETGARKLTEDWMRRIAKALDVEPADLLEAATFVNMSDEVEPFGNLAKTILGAMNASEMLPLRIRGSQLERIGIADGYDAVFAISPAAREKVATGDVVLAQVKRISDGKTARIVRQFISPSMLVTNRAGRNVTIDLDEPRFNVEIVGVLIKPN